jgi:hypothetical protein
MLTPEERARIEEEERRAYEAEQYRATVRSKLERESPPPEVRPKPGLGRWVLVALAVVAAFLGIRVLSQRSHTGGSSEAGAAGAPMTPPILVRYVPVDVPIASGQITVPARSYVSYKIVVTPEMVDPVISGNFNASGGMGNDVRALLSDEPNFTNWINGHEASGFWSTNRETTASFSVHPPPGTYVLALSNQFSLISGKQVFVDFHLNYKRKESALP